MKQLLIYVLSALFLLSCSFANKKTEDGASMNNASDTLRENYIKEIIDESGKKIVKYGNDSSYIFTKNGHLESIFYFSEQYPIDNITYYPSQKIKELDYRIRNENDTIDYKGFYENGLLKYIELIRDTVFAIHGNNIKGNKLYTEYYENGRVKISVYSNTGMGTFVGLQKSYNDLGQLIETRNYIFPNDTVSYININEYYFNGKVKAKKVYENFLYYGVDEEYKVPIGTWEFYDKSGKLIKTEKQKQNFRKINKD